MVAVARLEAPASVRILVTGGAGFIGSHLVERLLRLGHRVDVVDSFVTGRPENLRHLRTVRLRVVESDVTRLRDGTYDQIFHLASPASPVAYLRAQRSTLVANGFGTYRVLELARRSRSRVVFASTSEVYGSPTVHPQPESYWGNVNPTGPRSAYDEGKRFGEALVVAYVRECGVDARIARIFNTYGPRMRLDDGRMPSAFIGAALRGDPLRIEGDGSQTRSLCYVDDTVRGLFAAMRRGVPGGIYNLGRPDEMSVLDFANLVLKSTRSRSEVCFVADRPETIARRRPDISRATRELGWTPRVPLAIGLPRTVAWFRKQIAREKSSGRKGLGTRFDSSRV